MFNIYHLINYFYQNRIWLSCNAYCEGEDIPTLTASAEPGLEIFWYDACAGNEIAANTSSFTPTTPGTYVIVAINPLTNCASDCVDIILTENPNPILSNEPPICAPSLTTYEVVVNSNTPITTSSGTLIDNMNGTFTISDITTGNDLTVSTTNTNNCTTTITVTAPDCICTAIAAPIPTNNSYCAGETIPTLTATAAIGLEIHWYDTCDENELAANTTTFTPPTAGTYVIIAIDPITGCISDCVNITMTENENPIVSANDPTCAVDLSSYSVVINSDAPIVTSSGTVVDNMDGTFTISGIANNVDLNVNATNTTTNCTTSINVVAPDCSCPSIVAPIAINNTYCAGDAIPELTATIEPGLQLNWYDVCNGTALATNTINFTPSAPGTFVIVAVDPITGCTSDCVNITLTENALPIVSAGTTDCNNALTTYEVTITSDAPITATDGILLDNMDGTYTISAISEGTDIDITATNSTNCSTTITILSPNCNCVDILEPIVTNETICEGDVIPSLNVVVDAGLEVSWYDACGGLEIATNTLTYTPIAAGSYFVIATDPITDCSSDCIEITLTENAIPTIIAAIPFCADDLLTYEVIITSSSAITSSEGTVLDNMNGTYTISSIPSGNNITVDAINTTTNCSNSITVNAPNCDCDDIQEPIANNVSICEGEVIPALSVTAQPGLEVNWYDACGGTELATNTTTYTPTTAGTFVVVAIDPATGCPSDCVDVILTTNPIPVITADEPDCADDLLTYSVIINADADISSSAGDVTDNMNGTFNIDNITSGINIVVTSTNCSATDVVEVILDVAGPIALILQDTATLDCITAVYTIDGTPSDAGPNIQYEWSGPNSEDFSATALTVVSAQGTYVLTVVDILNGCLSSDSIVIVDNVEFPTLDPGPISGLDCTTNEITLNGENSQASETISNLWIDPMGDTISLTTMATATLPGDYILIGYDTNNNCLNDTIVTVLQDIQIPLVDAGNDVELDCDFSDVTIGSNNSAAGLGIVYEWASNNDVILPLNPGQTIVVDAPGTYYFTVSDDNNGCSAVDSVNVSENTNVPLDANIIAINPTCFGDNNGSITIESITGGTPPYLYSLDGNVFSTINQFNFLSSAEYTVYIQDADGCALEIPGNIVEASNELTLDLGENITIDLGDSHTIIATPNIDQNLIDTIGWTSIDSLDCYDCFENTVTPFETTTYQASMTDINGCTTTDEITIIVKKERNVFIPNSFSPNGDGLNDVVFIHADDTVVKINTFFIVDRWGEIIFQQQNFQPNNPQNGWDGTFRDEPVNPEVFVYYAEIEFIDGQVEEFKGDIFLAR